MQEPFVVITIGNERTTVAGDFASSVEQLPSIPPTAEELAARLAAAKRARLAAIEAARDLAIFSGMDTPAGRVDTTQRSVDIINGYATSAVIAQLAGEPFLVSFRLADNSEVPIDGPTMLALKLALDRQVAGAYRWSWNAKAQVEAADSVEAVDAVSLDVVIEEAANG